MFDVINIGSAVALGLGATFLLGGIAKGALGFGMPLITISILPMIVPIDMALALNAVILPFTNFTQFVQSGPMMETIRRFWPLTTGMIIGIAGGALFITVVDPRILSLILGLFVMTFVAVMVLKPQFHVPARAERSTGWGVGLASGVVGSLTTANGPLLVMYLVGLNVPRQLFLSALSLMFIVLGAMLSASYFMIGVLDFTRVLIAVACLVPALTGMAIGNWLVGKLPADKFKLLVLIVLFILGANMVWRALGAD
ncbi:sulfite exporter TauE/SafE family protein [Telmatospirillum sp. J64-1]|uniref:sulfite exporter TauE/SafE family protein n=1 Tax=Telmatospirillum sp. J64-1 TaxID=2502183 RepID=UPI00115E93FC|nr:sulfite exporter TauE/SafE family protein [Telmatospirillum sp. J64-1]